MGDLGVECGTAACAPMLPATPDARHRPPV